MGWIVGIAVLVLLAIWFVGIYNSLIKANVRVEEGFSTVDVSLQKRFDMIPNIINAVKGYMAHEAETLEALVKERNAGASVEDKIKSDAQITPVINRLLALAENYPDLKASAQFSELNAQLSAVEAELSEARRYYNGTVREFNIKIKKIPDVVVANIMGYGEKPFFEVTSEDARNNVKVEF